MGLTDANSRRSSHDLAGIIVAIRKPKCHGDAAVRSGRSFPVLALWRSIVSSQFARFHSKAELSHGYA